MIDIRHVRRRYDKRVEQNGTWTVFDTFTGRPANVGSRLSTGMAIVDAEGLVDILNCLHPANDAGTVH